MCANSLLDSYVQLWKFVDSRKEGVFGPPYRKLGRPATGGVLLAVDRFPTRAKYYPVVCGGLARISLTGIMLSPQICGHKFIEGLRGQELKYRE